MDHFSSSSVTSRHLSHRTDRGFYSHYHRPCKRFRSARGGGTLRGRRKKRRLSYFRR